MLSRCDCLYQFHIREEVRGERKHCRYNYLWFHSGAAVSNCSHVSDPVDLILLLDKSISSDIDFEAAKQFAEAVVLSANADDYKSRIRASLITFTDKAQTELELRKSPSQEDLIYALQRAENTGGDTSVPTGFQLQNHKTSSALVSHLVSFFP